MRRMMIPLIVLLAAGMTAAAAFGSSVHFSHGSSISCTWSTTSFTNDTVTCTGTGGLSGLGNANVAFALSGAGGATYFCKNPGNGTEAQGQNRVPFTAPTVSTVVPASSIKNGRLDFFGPGGNTIGPDTATATSASGTAAGCPNDSWTTRTASVFWTSVDLAIQQPAGTTIIDCTASNPNGLSGTVTLSCA